MLLLLLLIKLNFSAIEHAVMFKFACVKSYEFLFFTCFHLYG